MAGVCGSGCTMPLGGPSACDQCSTQWQKLASQKANLARVCEQLYIMFCYYEQLLHFWVG